MSQSPLIWLDEDSPFPELDTALAEPNGLLAAGGSLSIKRLIAAYYRGIFPWNGPDQVPLWWSPDPRAILMPGELHVSKSLRKWARQHPVKITSDRAFARVVDLCARRHEGDHWITTEMQDAYCQLFAQSHAHSLEVWIDDRLIGGLYGVQVGALFCGESMFHTETNGSKIAFSALANTLFAAGFHLIDCQIQNSHLHSLGVTEVARDKFISHLYKARDVSLSWPTEWHFV